MKANKIFKYLSLVVDDIDFSMIVTFQIFTTITGIEMSVFLQYNFNLSDLNKGHPSSICFY